MTTFLPQPRIASRNARSVSVNGRSAEVTNRTRSARGTNSVVRRSCSRMIALVPGVSTMWMSWRKSTGAVTDADARAQDLGRGRVAVADEVNLRGRRRHAFVEDRAAEQRVDERALAGVELADDDEEEELVELADGFGEGGASRRWPARTPARPAGRPAAGARPSAVDRSARSGRGRATRTSVRSRRDCASIVGAFARPRDQRAAPGTVSRRIQAPLAVSCCPVSSPAVSYQIKRGLGRFRGGLGFSRAHRPSAACRCPRGDVHPFWRRFLTPAGCDSMTASKASFRTGVTMITKCSRPPSLLTVQFTFSAWQPMSLRSAERIGRQVVGQWKQPVGLCRRRRR